MSQLDAPVSIQYQSLKRHEQLRFLAALSDRMTLLARATYDDKGGVADPIRLRDFNEAQHRILAQLRHLACAEEARYPDDVFVELLCDQFAALEIELPLIQQMLDRSVSLHGPP